MQPSSYAIHVNGLQKKYGEVCVLQDVNFAVERGTVFSLLGSNGAGKTTTVKILTTLVHSDHGEISICGHDVTKDAQSIHRCISLTGQFAAVDEMLSGLENLVIMGKLHGIKNAKAKAKELLTYFDLQDCADRLVSTYSGGMRRKLDIAMSLVNQPKVLFLDEPTTGLDPQSRHAMWEIIQDLKRQGTTIFLTTQYLEEAEELADQIAILHQGSIIVQGTVEECKSLLPQEAVSFTFATKQDYERAFDLLSREPVLAEEAELTLTLSTCEAIQVLTNFIPLFAQHQIALSDFTRKTPSLEDVFLSLVNEKEVVDHAERA